MGASLPRNVGHCQQVPTFRGIWRRMPHAWRAKRATGNNAQLASRIKNRRETTGTRP